MIKNQNYAGLCEQWIEDVTNSSIKGDTAYDSWKTFKGNGGVSGLNGIQPGDIVYLSPNQSNGEDGHAGIWNGNNYFTSATDRGVEVNNINDWTQKTGQQILGYVPRSKLSDQQGKGGGSMSNYDPNTLVWVKAGGQYIQSKLSDVGAYGLDPNTVPPQNIVSNNPNPPGTQPGASAGGMSSTTPNLNAPPLSPSSIKGNVAATIAKPAQEYAQGQQQIAKNANDIAKQSLDLQQQAFNTDATLAPKVLSIDLSNKMTLRDAMAKYGKYMKPEDIFSQYNEYNSTTKNGYGPAKESVAELQQMGFNNIPKAVQDKQDSISAMNLIQSLESAWSEYTKTRNPEALSKYTVLMSQLQDPSSNYGKLVAKYRDSFPAPWDYNPLDPKSEQGAKGAFQGAEEGILGQSGGYGYKDLGMKPLAGFNATDIVSQAGKTIKGIGDFLFNSSQNIAKDIGTGMALNGKTGENLQNSQQGAIDMAKRAWEKAQTTKDPAEKTRLIKIAQDTLATVGQGSKAIANSFSPDVNQNPFLRGAAAGTEIAGAAELPSAIKSIARLGGKKAVAEAATQAPEATSAISKITKPFTKMGRYLTTTKGKTVKEMEQAVKKGGDLNWETIVKNARADIENKGTPAKKALERLISQENPAKFGEYKGSAKIDKNLMSKLAGTKLSSSEGFELRKGLGARMPSNMFEKALQKASTGAHVPQNQAIETLRRAVSAELKRAAPDITKPDEMYNFIKTMKGDVPTWGKRIIAGQILKYAADKLNIKGTGADFLEALPEALGLLGGG